MNLRRFLYRIILFAVQVIVFTITVYTTMLSISYQSKKQYTQAQLDPPDHFPILVIRNGSSPNTARRIEIIKWEHYQANLDNKDQFSTPLTTGKGDIVTAEKSAIQFSTQINQGNTIVAIEERTERGTIYWRYRVVDGMIVPMSRRAIGYAAIVVGIFPGIFLAWLSGRLGTRIVKQLNKD